MGVSQPDNFHNQAITLSIFRAEPWLPCLTLWRDDEASIFHKVSFSFFSLIDTKKLLQIFVEEKLILQFAPRVTYN